MGRQIRISASEALASGLIDPSLADLVSKASPSRKAAKPKPSRQKGGKAAPLPEKTAQKVAAKNSAKTAEKTADTSSETKPKRRRSPSRPAVHPKTSPGPAGRGTVEMDENGCVCGADFLFDLVPVPKERPRVVTNPKTEKAFGYTPARTKHFTVEVRQVVESVFKKRKPIAGPVRLEMTFVMQVPKGWPKWKKAAALEGIIAPTGRPDMDNLEKALLDAFNDCLIVDDAFVIDRRATKVYGEAPQILTRVEQTGQLDLNARRDAAERVRALRSSTSSQ